MAEGYAVMRTFSKGQRQQMRRKYASIAVGSRIIFKGREGFALVDRFGRVMTKEERDAISITVWRWSLKVEMFARHKTVDLERIWHYEIASTDRISLHQLGEVFESWRVATLLQEEHYTFDRVNYEARIIGA